MKGNSVDVDSKMRNQQSSPNTTLAYKGAKVTLGHTSKSKLKAANCTVRPWSGIAGGFDASR